MTVEARNQVIRIMRTGRGGGFTMIETVVVVLVLGVLAAVLPAYLVSKGM
jgi:prepilin-type N-terminal cleavage/methylation domain-containing protein